MSENWSSRKILWLVATACVVNLLIVLVEHFVILLPYRGVGRLVIPPAEWKFCVIAGVFAGQMMAMSVVGALVERRRWQMWLVATPMGALLSAGWFLMESWNYLIRFHPSRAGFLKLFAMYLEGLYLPTAFFLGGILVLSLLLWPFKVYCGWRITDGSAPFTPVRHISISTLMLWVALWAALFFLLTQLASQFGPAPVVPAVIGVVALLLGAMPSLYAANRRKWVFISLLISISATALISYAESESLFVISKVFGNGGSAIPLPPILTFNFSLALSVAINCLLLRIFGLRLHIPLWISRGKRTTPSSA